MTTFDTLKTIRLEQDGQWHDHIGCRAFLNEDDTRNGLRSRSSGRQQ